MCKGLWEAGVRDRWQAEWTVGSGGAGVGGRARTTQGPLGGNLTPRPMAAIRPGFDHVGLLGPGQAILDPPVNAQVWGRRKEEGDRQTDAGHGAERPWAGDSCSGCGRRVPCFLAALCIFPLFSQMT